MTWIMRLVQRVLNRSLLHPGSWAGWGLAVIAIWLLLHLLGWRVDTAIICGTIDPARGNPQWVMLRGTLYALTFVLAMTVSPVLILASALYVGLVAAMRRVHGGRISTPDARTWSMNEVTP